MKKETLPWRGIYDFLLEVGGSHSREEFSRKVMDEIRRLIPFDNSGGIFKMSGFEYLDGVGLSDSANRAYNDYYRLQQPWMEQKRLALLALTWNCYWRDFQESEYVRDFAGPSGIWYSLCPITSPTAVGLSLHRSRRGPAFTDCERGVLAVINPPLSNLYCLYDQLKGAEAYALPAKEEIAERFRTLSKREAEVLALLINHLSSAEIGLRLFVSGRTVEEHLSHIYDKLDVHSRAEAIKCVMTGTRGGQQLA